MDDERDTFEERLQAVAPAAPSAALRERLAGQLGPRRPARRPYVLGLAGLAAAACVGLGVWVWLAVYSSDTPGSPDAPGHVAEGLDEGPASYSPGPEPEPNAQTDAPAGSLLAYHRAMRTSPESVIAAMDRPSAHRKHNPEGHRDTPRPLDTEMFLHDNERPDDETNALPAPDAAIRVARLGTGRGRVRPVG